MLQIFAVALSFLAVVNAGCDNACSGHGICGERGICSCYDNWGLGMSMFSGDCSQRVCPFEVAWIDTPDKRGGHHKYAECAARGLCNRESGECECFPGYEGKACARSVCPNDCSGHGRCAYIEDMPYKVVPQDYMKGNFLAQSPMTLPYYSWDKTKTRGCVCDPEYGDVDCSKRMCPFGTDIMDQRLNMVAAKKYQVQQIFFRADGDNYGTLAARTFALTFKSKLNETFTTYPIAFKGATLGFHDFVLDVQRALMALPNRVIDLVEVHGSKDITTGKVTLNITFTGDHVQGAQNLITVKSYVCGDGCTPKISGLELAPKTNNITEVVLSDFNSFECGRRGKCDYSTGICGCFAGYTGISCNVITSLV